MATAANSLPLGLLWQCCKNKDLSRGTQLHHQLQERGLPEQNYSDALITMYAKCGELQKAQALLNKHGSSSIIPWTALIAGYAREGRGQDALHCFERMRSEGISPNAVAYVCILKTCAITGSLDRGKQIHDEVSRQGLLQHNIILGNALVDMYAKCGDLGQAQIVLENLPFRDVFSWSALIAGYAQKGQGCKALECFDRMHCEGIPPNAVTYVSILKACAAIRALDRGRQIHDEISRQGLLENKLALGGALVDMYARCGDLPRAQNVLEKLSVRDVVSWSALIAGYAQNGQYHEASRCYKQMKREGVSPNSVTYLNLLKACAATRALDEGRKIHNRILRHGLLEHNVELGVAIVDMYAKCDALFQAENVRESLPACDVIAWNALLTGYVQNGQGQEALDCYERMQRSGIKSDSVTYVCLLKACAQLGAVDRGKQYHDEVSRQGFLDQSTELGGALVDMYAKCGALLQAEIALKNLRSRNVISWNALIAGYGHEGQGDQAFRAFVEMQHEGIRPDAITFLSLLNLCSHLGLVSKGQDLFDNMGVMYGLEPDVDCYACMVDLLGRAGHLLKAVEMIQAMPISASLAIWLSLLGACQEWANVDVGIWAFNHAVYMDKSDATPYIIMANIYAAAGMLDKAKDIEAMRVKNKAWKESGGDL